MKLVRQCTMLIAAGLLVSALSTGLFAQATDSQQPERDKSPATMTGCLSKDAAGAYVLTDATGAKIMVSGVPELEKHSANHTVRLTGKMSADATGKPTMEVSKLQHVSDTCKEQPK